MKSGNSANQVRCAQCQRRKAGFTLLEIISFSNSYALSQVSADPTCKKTPATHVME
jgi:hypothetical protein